MLRGAGLVLAIGAEDLEVREGAPSRWRVKIVLAGEGMRLETRGTLSETELPAFARDIDALVAGTRTAASLASEDGVVFVTIDRRGDVEAGIAIRVVRDVATGAYSVVEVRGARADAEDFARRAHKFPY